MSFREATGRRDPKPVSEVLDGLAREPGWGDRLMVGRLRERWADVAGAVVAAHSEPVRIEAGILVVKAEPGAWATELSLLGKVLATRAAAVAGAGTVTTVRVVSDLEQRGPRSGRKPAAQRGYPRAGPYGKKGL